MPLDRSPNGLLIPAIARDKCTMCLEEIPRPVFAAHAEKCFREHENELQAEAAQKSMPIFERDEERYQHMRRKGRNGAA